MCLVLLRATKQKHDLLIERGPINLAVNWRWESQLYTAVFRNSSMLCVCVQVHQLLSAALGDKKSCHYVQNTWDVLIVIWAVLGSEFKIGTCLKPTKGARKPNECSVHCCLRFHAWVTRLHARCFAIYSKQHGISNHFKENFMLRWFCNTEGYFYLR